MSHDCIAVHYRPGPAWRAGAPLRDQALGPHLAYLTGLPRETLLMGGPYSDLDRTGYVPGDPTPPGGLVILNASRDEAEALIAADPAVRDGILAAEIREWARVV